ncbi:hypothetical protein LEP1GSC043_0139 [Leptospira weilii str. Ecochallenge]|uniref:Uncharacterized protein n=1 Tax=Leptospira weilii str. Ecochallenge TaxID=1049986 RepID=N1UD79_9LEPT|nr:hypothetical protein LEP1GSC043_0139 [Leptospira weilii str. Ecochallenge]
MVQKNLFEFLPVNEKQIFMIPGYLGAKKVLWNIQNLFN